MDNKVIVFILLGLVVGGVLGYGGATYSLQSKINEFSVLLEEKESEYDTLLAEYIKKSNDFLILNSSFNTLTKEYNELTRVHSASEEIRNAVMSYIRDHHQTTARLIGDIVWIGGDITPSGLVGKTTYQYLGGGWNVTISWAVIAKPIFEVRAEYCSPSGDLCIFWEGTVDHAGVVEEKIKGSYQSVEGVRDSVMDYIGKNHPDAAIYIEDLVWSVTPPEPIPGWTEYHITGDGWNVTIGHVVYYDTTYEVKAENRHEGITWTGTVYDGVVNETSYEKKPPVIEGYIQVYDEKLGYGFEHPEHWEKQIPGYDFPYEKVEVFTEEGKPTRVVISVKSSNFKSLEEVKEFGYISQESILKDGFIEVNDRDAYEVTFNQPPDKKARWVIFLANDKEYTIQCSTTEGLYAAYEDIFDYIINSFYIE